VGQYRQQNYVLLAGFLGNLMINLCFVGTFGPIAAASGTLVANIAYYVNFRWVKNYLGSGIGAN